MKKLNAVIVIVTVIIFSSCISSHNASLKYHKVNSTKGLNETMEEELVLKNPLENKSEIIEVKQKINLDSECDELILRNGENKLVEILVLGKEKIRYKDCLGSKSGEEEVATTEIDSLIFSSGTVIVFNIDGSVKGTNREEKNVFKENSLNVEDFTQVIEKEERVKKIDSYKDDESLDNSMARLISNLSRLSFIPVIGFIFSIIVFIKSHLGIKKIKKNPEKYSGERKIRMARRYAILSLSIGAAIVLIFAILYLVVLF